MIANEVDDSQHVVLNENEHTRITDQCKSSPDISLASSELAMSIDWHTECALGSDHRPIILSIQCEVGKIISSNKTYINFRKANWPGFSQQVEYILSRKTIPTNIHKGEKMLRKAVLSAAGRKIPQGRL